MKRKIYLIVLLTLEVFYFPNIFIPQKVTAQVESNEEYAARCLTNKGFVMYGATECSACAIQKGYFGEYFSLINYVNCDERRSLCDAKNIHAYPTWEDGNGRVYKGAIDLNLFSKISGCQPPTPLTAVKEKTEIFRLYLNQILAAFIAGIVSFLAPCLLPLLPSYFSVITGFTFADLYGLNFEKIRGRVFLSGLFFALGFAIVFTLLGATGSVVGQILDSYMPVLLKASGVFLIILGFLQLGVIKVELLQFDFAWRVQRRLTKLGFLTAVVTGIAAALSWIPCIGPLLTPILILSAKSETVVWGAFLLLVYSLGLTLPFLAAGLFFPSIVSILSRHRLAFHRLSQAAGIFLVVFGGVLLVDKYKLLIQYFNSSIIPLLRLKLTPPNPLLN